MQVVTAINLLINPFVVQASQSLAKSDNGDDRLWKATAEEVHKDADKLFKMIGEAYAVLSDSIKVRACYHSALFIFPWLKVLRLTIFSSVFL